MDGLLTSYYSYGLYLLLFKDHACNEQWTLNYINMVILLVVVSPKVAVYLVVLSAMIMFAPCLIYFLI